jgi:ubiquinone/menaquinone biosynthesis C-methylase UbiE
MCFLPSDFGFSMVKRSNRRFHDRVARKYDKIYEGPYWRFYRDVSWRHLKGFLPTERPAWAADLGCGTGWFGRRLIKAGFHVVFLDPSGGMLEQARQAVEAEGTRGQETRFVQGELEDLSEIDDGSLAFATAQGDPLSFCKSPQVALRELRRVTSPDARIVLSVDNRVAGVRSLLDRPNASAALELLRTGRTEWLARRSEERFPMKMFDPDELESLLAKAGFAPLGTIAKTCLVTRANEAWLEDPAVRKRLLDAEEKVHKLRHYFGLAAHLQIAGRRE